MLLVLTTDFNLRTLKIFILCVYWHENNLSGMLLFHRMANAGYCSESPFASTLFLVSLYLCFYLCLSLWGFLCWPQFDLWIPWISWLLGGLCPPSHALAACSPLECLSSPQAGKSHDCATSWPTCMLKLRFIAWLNENTASSLCRITLWSCRFTRPTRKLTHKIRFLHF